MGRDLTANIRRLIPRIWSVRRNRLVKLTVESVADDTRAISAHHEFGRWETGAPSNSVAERQRSQAQVNGNGG